ncbi:MAG: MASE1 domain-containing protein [Gammaproteobacteria bacterium]
MKTIVLNSAIACIYCLMGILALQLIVPFSKVGSIWPSAGLALATSLIYGKRILPGIFIGNTLVNIYAFDFNIENLPVYLAIGLGAPAGAWVGSELIRRFVGFPNDWIKDRDIVIALFGCAPIGCAVSAGIGVSAIALRRFITPDEILLNGVCWWIGDIIGILIFTPMILALLQQNQPVWRSRRLSLTIPLSIAFTFVVLFFFFVLQQEEKMQRQHFAGTTALFAHTLEKQIETHVQLAKTIRNIYAAGPQSETLKRCLHDHTSMVAGVESIEWYLSPAVGDPESQRTYWSEKIQHLPAYNRIANDDVYSYIEGNNITLIVPLTQRENILSGLVNYKLSLRELIRNISKQISETPITLTISRAGTGETLFSNLENIPYTFSESIPLSNSKIIGDNWIFHLFQNPSLSNDSASSSRSSRTKTRPR